MPHLALMTIGVLRAPWGDPLVRGFEERIDETFATAAASPGFVARIGAVERGALDGGPQVDAPSHVAWWIDAGALHADAAGAYAEEDRLLDTDAHASPTVHPVTVADLADEFTRLDLTDPATSCR